MKPINLSHLTRKITDCSHTVSSFLIPKVFKVSSRKQDVTHGKMDGQTQIFQFLLKWGT
jgi:hypothetical protein